MSDSNNSLDILIRFLNDEIGAEKTKELLSGIRKQAESIERAQISSANSVRDQMDPALAHLNETTEDAAKKTEHHAEAHRQVKAALKGVAAQFPELAHAAHLALNPITLSLAAIVGAIAIFKQKNEEAVKSLGGFELPDISENLTDRYQRISAALASVASSVEKISANKDAFDKFTEISNSFAVGAGMKTQEEVDALKAQAAREAGDRLTASGQANLAAAGPISPENKWAQKMPEFLSELEAERKRIQENQRLILGVADAGPFGNPLRIFKYAFKNGFMGTDEAMSIQDAALSRVNSQIDSVNQFGVTRGRRLSAFNNGNSEIAKGNAYYDEAAAGMGKQAGAAGKDVVSALNQLGTIDIDKLAIGIARMAEAVARGQAAVEKGVQDLERKVNTNNQR